MHLASSQLKLRLVQGMHPRKGLVDPFHLKQDITHEQSFGLKIVNRSVL
jgi:hypothetical protein